MMNYMPYILQPTCVTDRSATLIDNSFANTFNFSTINSNLITNLSDHFPQFLITEDLKVNYASLNYFKYDYSHFCEEVFVQEIAELGFSLIYNCNLTNDEFNLFHDQINSVSKKHVPYKKLAKKKAKLSFKP